MANAKKTKLLIVESPSKAKTIEKYLSGEFMVRASIGHIRDLPKSNKNAIDIAGGFVPHYEISPDKKRIVSELKTLAGQAEEVVLATDPDREGEAIAWHIKEAIGLKNPKRIVFHEITKEAVADALKQPRTIDDNLRQAQEARRVLDRLFGYDLSGLIWQKLRYGLSAGRVQSPALRILVEREKEIRTFVPENFWVIEALLKSTTAKEPIPFVCSVEPKTKATADEIVMAATKSAWQVGLMEEAEAIRAARAPFITSTLQQAASSRLGYSPSITMRLAQHLYEKGLITYMRTDSVTLSGQALGEIAQVVTNKFGSNYSKPQQYVTKSKNAQEAHEAIRPTHINQASAGVTSQEKKLYDLIWRRAVASQMADVLLVKTKVMAIAADKDVPEFRANGSRIKFSGWLAADPAAAGEDIILPPLREGEPLSLDSIKNEGRKTEPPRRYSEAGLVKELEKRGIGRPSTYASIIKTIQDRDYAVKENKILRPTETGEVVSDFLSKHFGKYVSDTFTAEMEDELDEIAAGQRGYEKTLKDFYGPFSLDVKSKFSLAKLSDLGAAPADIKCPICGGSMIIKLSRGGKFYSCAKYPDCAGARKIDGTELEAPQETGEICPDCGTGKLTIRDGRFGQFIACSNYPKCKYIKKDPSAEKASDTGVECPMCQTGTMTEKHGRFGLFYGCSGYPKCQYIIKSKPTGQICGYPRESGPCPHLMMAGTKTIPERCSDKTCPNHHPHKLDKIIKPA